MYNKITELSVNEINAVAGGLGGKQVPPKKTEAGNAGTLTTCGANSHPHTDIYLNSSDTPVVTTCHEGKGKPEYTIHSA